LVSRHALEFADNVKDRIDPSKHRDPITGQDLALYAPATEASGWKSVPLTGPQPQPVTLPPAKPGYHWEKIAGFDEQVPDAGTTISVSAPAPTVDQFIDAFCTKVVLVNGMTELGFKRKV
jgi:hypothetical protein